MVTNKTHGTFEDILAAASPELRPVCKSLRHQIGLLDKHYVEIVWPAFKIASFGIGPKKMTEHYVYISVQSSYINLGFYHGASLADPSGLLEGAGKKLRHIKIRDGSAARNPAVKALLRRAIANRKRQVNEV
ncbi:MAG TPA: DUF1801 domain-containing protein [Alphaproteobacteria bacterium]|nr:DUF1801 domain-containing protein [Alphaproteobacteria bacterium]